MEIAVYIIGGIILALLVVLGMIGGALALLKVIFDLMDRKERRKRFEALNREDRRRLREEERRLIKEAINASYGS